MPFSQVGASMSWGEAFRLTGELLNDPTSRVAASARGWKHPWSHEWAVAADLYDLLHAVYGGRKAEPYPRPWVDKTKGRRTRPTVSQEVVIAALREAGHVRPVPTS